MGQTIPPVLHMHVHEEERLRVDGEVGHDVDCTGEVAGVGKVGAVELGFSVVGGGGAGLE